MLYPVISPFVTVAFASAKVEIPVTAYLFLSVVPIPTPIGAAIDNVIAAPTYPLPDSLITNDSISPLLLTIAVIAAPTKLAGGSNNASTDSIETPYLSSTLRCNGASS